MPTRTYTGVDLLNYIFDHVEVSKVEAGGTIASIPVETAQAIFSVSFTGSGSVDQFTPTEIAITTETEMRGDFDFDSFPEIPDGSLINSFDTQIDYVWNLLVNADTVSANSSAFVTLNVQIDLLDENVSLGNLTTSENIQDPVDGIGTPGDHNAQATGSKTTSTHNIIEFNPPITKAELLSLYKTLRIFITTILRAVSGQDLSNDGGTFSVIGGWSVDNFIHTVTYQDGPVTVTLNPSGGNVKVGQQITATGPKAAELTYAAISGGLVQPIIPKIISPAEVLLEVPYPASDPCFDCFPDCPECDEAFIPCDEDLTSDACQEALQECLDCLTNCLESLELAEQCQASLGATLVEPVGVVIICGTEFGGSVTLGNFTVLVANGSGIYRFVLGKTNDTVYDPARDGTTYDVKIPNPGGKTGFFRS